MSFPGKLILLIGATVLVCIPLFFSLNTKNRINFTNNSLLTTPSITIADPQLGPTDAKVTLVVFTDYQCPACNELATTLHDLHERFPRELRIVHKDMPNRDRHPEAWPAAIAAQCAGKQGKFWEFDSALTLLDEPLDADIYHKLAEDLSLRLPAFDRCVEKEETRALVQRSFDEGVDLQISATPTIFFGEERKTGALTATDIINWTNLK